MPPFGISPKRSIWETWADFGRGEQTRVGAEGRTTPRIRFNEEKQTHPIPDQTGGAGNSQNTHAFPTAKRLRQIEHEFSVSHDPGNGSGGALFRGYNSHNGCRLTSETCRLDLERMKAKELQGAVQAQLIRHGGLVCTRKTKPDEVDGLIQPLRASDAACTAGDQ